LVGGERKASVPAIAHPQRQAGIMQGALQVQPGRISQGGFPPALQTIFHLCIPKKDLAKPHFYVISTNISKRKL